MLLLGAFVAEKLRQRLRGNGVQAQETGAHGVGQDPPGGIVTEGLNNCALGGITCHGGVLFGPGFDPLEGIVSVKIGCAGIVGLGQVQIPRPGVGAFPVGLINRAGLLSGGVQAKDVCGVAESVPLINHLIDQNEARQSAGVQIGQMGGGVAVVDDSI